MIKLLDEELALLDGKVRPEIQKEVDAAKERLKLAAMHRDLPPKLAGLIADAIHEAQIEGRLVFRWDSIRHCTTCGADAGYGKHKGTGRYHRKGQIDYNKPLYMGGVELAHRCITMKGYVNLGCCTTCWEKVKEPLIKCLEEVRAEIPKTLTGHDPKFRRFDRRRCTKCGWEGHEGEMWMMPAMMQGYYHGGCPKCPADNQLFSRVIEIVDGFVVVPAGEENLNRRPWKIDASP